MGGFSAAVFLCVCCGAGLFGCGAVDAIESWRLIRADYVASERDPTR